METTYLQCLRYDYLNGTFEGGIVLNSKHPQNDIYLSFSHDTDLSGTWIHELTMDEANCIIACLAHSMVAKLKEVDDAFRCYDENEEENKGQERATSVCLPPPN